MKVTTPPFEEYVAAWNAWAASRDGAASGSCYVYAFRDAAGSVFYVGKGHGDRMHDVEKHRHGRLGYYVAEFLGGTYAVDILRDSLSHDDAELLEAMLIQRFGQQLVNWAGNWAGATTLTAEAVDRMRHTAQTLRDRARSAAEAGRNDEAVSLCREALAFLSDWERHEHQTECEDLRRLSRDCLAARVDLHRLERDYVPQAPVLACEALSDLTRYLCKLGRAEEAKSEVEAFKERYPHGSFRDYEIFDHRYGRTLRIAVTQREQATLKRVEQALARSREAPLRRRTKRLEAQ